MKLLLLMAGFTYIVFASSYVPNVCKPFENMGIDQVISNKHDYAGSCKLLFKQIGDAKEAQMPQKALCFGYVLQTLEDLERFGLETSQNKIAVKTVFEGMNKSLIENNVIDASDDATVYKGLLLAEDKVYRLYVEDFNLKVIKEEIHGTTDVEKMYTVEEHRIVNTKGDCLSVRKNPSKRANLIKCIKNKSQLLTIPDSNELNGYINVEFMGGTGWVSKAYTKSNKDK